MTISVALLAVVGIAVSLPNYRQPHGGEVAIADGSETDALPRTPSLREAEAPEAETGLGTTSPDPNSTTNLGDPSYVRIDLQGDAYTPALLDGYLYVVENGEDASRILRVDPETATVAATNELPIATAGPAVVGTAALIPFEQEGSPGLLWLDRSAREVDRFMPDEGAGDAVWRAQDPVFVGADLEDFEHDIFVRWGPSYRAVQFSNRIAGRRELAPGPVVAWDSPAGAVVWLLYPELGVLNRAEPLTESGERLVVRLEPELHGSGHEIIHPAPDGSLWLASRERIVTRIDGLTGEITGSVAAGACPVEDPLVGCRSLPSAGHGLVAHDSYWLTNRGDGALHRIDLASLELKASVQLSAGSTLGTPVATDDEILVSDHSRAVVHRIDVESNSLVSTIELECASGPCGEWAVGVEWQHRPLAVEGEVWLPWGEAIFRIR